MKRKRSQSKSNQQVMEKPKECKLKSKDGKVIKVNKNKQVPHITKANVKKVVSLKNAESRDYIVDWFPKNAQSKSSAHGIQMNLLYFPDEILMKFQSFLTYHSTCQCVKTCRRLYQVYSDPSLWADMPLNRQKMIKIRKGGLAELKIMSRFANIKHINLTWMNLTPIQLSEVLQYSCWRNEKGTSLDSLDLSWNDLRKVSSDLLKEAVCSIQDVNLNNTKITTTQLNDLLSFIPNKNTLKKLDLSSINLNHDIKDISPKLLKEAVCHLVDVNMGRNWLITTQLNALFSFIPTKHNLKKINLSYSQVDLVCPELMSEAICHCEDVELTFTRITTTQINSLFSCIPTKNALKRLDLSLNNLGEVSPKLLKEAVCCIEDVNLTNTNLNTSQLSTLLSTLQLNTLLSNKHILKKIYLGYDNLKKVSPETLKMTYENYFHSLLISVEKGVMCDYEDLWNRADQSTMEMLVEFHESQNTKLK